MKVRRLAFVVMILIVIATGCSKGGSDPIGGNTVPDQAAISSLDSLPVIGFDGNSAIGLLGAYNLTIDPDYADAELTPLRTSSIGESFLVSGESFFVTRPCAKCLRIERITITQQGDVALGFWITHPFPMGDPGQPPSGFNRLDLDLFDVALVAHPQNRTARNYPLLQTQLYTDCLKNADGYTKELAGVTGDNSALPYKICFERSQKNRFGMGVADEYFYIVISKTGMSFNLYLTFGYGASATFLERLEPTYYVPEFNRKAAWKVKVTGTTWYGADPGQVKIDIYDWNHGATVATTYPDLAHPNYISATSNVASVLVEVPGMTDDPVIATTTDTRTNGWDDPLTYYADFSNENSIPQGEYTGIVKVLDSRQPGTGLEGNTLIHSPNGVALEVNTLSEFATYQTFTAIIAPPCGPITGQVLSPATCPVTGVIDDALIDFTVTASSANNGNPITLYEVDWDYNGTTFTADASNITGVFNDLGPFINPNCPVTTPEIYTVAFRATDSCLHPNTTIFATCDVHVDTCCGPVTGEILSPTCPVSGVANNSTLDFTVAAESANGGDPVVLYEADYDYDGVTFDVDGSSVSGSFNEIGPFRNPNCPGTGEPAIVTVAFRAKDSCNPPNITIFATCEVTVDICSGWTLTWGGSEADQGMIVRKDSDDNIYVVGYFSDTVDLDPGIGTLEKTSNGGTDIFLSRFNSLGVFEWSLVFGGDGDDAPSDMYLDSSNNIFLTGYYTGTCDFNPGTGEDNHSSTAGTSDIFVSKINSSGVFQFAKTWGGESSETGDTGGAVITDSSGNIYITGYYEGTADFDPGAGTVTRTSSSLADFFLSSLDSSGNYRWAFTLGSWGYDEGWALAIDNSGNILAAGGFMASFDFDPGVGVDSHVSAGDYDIFITKYDSSGVFAWAKTWGGASADRAFGMAKSDSGQIFITGYFNETVDFDPDITGETLQISEGMNDVFLSRFNTDGTFSFVESWGGDENDQAYDVVILGDFMLVAGSFRDTNVDFDPASGTDNYSSVGGLDCFVSIFQVSTFGYIEARTWGGTQDDEARSTAFDASDNYLVTGGYRSTVDFDPSQYTDNRISNGVNDVFLSNLVN